MAIRIIDYKKVDMTNDEYDYYKKLVAEFEMPRREGSDQFRDIFKVDSEGCISMIQPPLKKEVGWAVIVFLQNLMINQRLRRMERWVQSIMSGEQK